MHSNLRNLFFALPMAALLLGSPPASAEDWTPWYSLTDGHQNRLDVRYRRSDIKTSDGRGDVNYQFRSRYVDAVSFRFKIVINAGEIAADSQAQLGPKGGTSYEGAYVRNAKDIWVKIESLRRAGSSTLLPRAE